MAEVPCDDDGQPALPPARESSRRFDHNRWTAIAALITGISALGAILLQANATHVAQQQTAEQIELSRKQIQLQLDMQQRQWQTENARRLTDFAEHVVSNTYTTGEGIKLKIENSNLTPAEVWVLTRPAGSDRPSNRIFQIPACSAISQPAPPSGEWEVVLIKAGYYWKVGANPIFADIGKVGSMYGAKNSEGVYVFSFEGQYGYEISPTSICPS